MTLWQRNDLVTAWRGAQPAPEAQRPIFFDTETPLGQDPRWPLLINNYERSEAKWKQLNDLFLPDPKTSHKPPPGATGGNLVATELLNRYSRMQKPPYPRGTLLPLCVLGMDVMAVAVSHPGKPHAWEFWFPKTGRHPFEVFSRKMKKFFIGAHCQVFSHHDVNWLAHTNVDWLGAYLGPTKRGEQAGGPWMQQLKTLRDLNLGVAPIYFGHQEVRAGIRLRDPVKEGKEDAADAVNLANRFRDNDPQKRLNPRAVIYLDIEGPLPAGSGQKIDAYYKTWAKGVADGGFWPGVYCSPIDAQRFKDAVMETVVWVANFSGANVNPRYPFPVKDPAGGAKVNGANVFSGAAISIWHWVGDRHIPELRVPQYDFDGSLMEDPSDTGFGIKWT